MEERLIGKPISEKMWVVSWRVWTLPHYKSFTFGRVCDRPTCKLTLSRPIWHLRTWSPVLSMVCSLPRHSHCQYSVGIDVVASVFSRHRHSQSALSAWLSSNLSVFSCQSQSLHSSLSVHTHSYLGKPGLISRIVLWLTMAALPWNTSVVWLFEKGPQLCELITTHCVGGLCR